MTDKLNEIKSALENAREIAVYCHTNPDGDTIACALSLFHALTKVGKTVTLYCDSEIPAKYAFLNGADKFELPKKGVHELGIALDCSDLDRLGGAAKSFLSCKSTLAVDHHKSHSPFASVYHVEADASACSEIMFRLLDGMNAVDNVTAEILFAGIVADSGCFQYPSTTRNTHKIACALLKYDFDASDVIYRVHRKISRNVFALKMRVLSKCRFFEDGKIAIITFLTSDFESTGTETSDTEGIISSAIDVDGVEVAFAVSEVKDKNFKVSVRTKNYVDASDVAGEFGGGGHEKAAGCRLNGYYEDVVDKLVKTARDRL